MKSGARIPSLFTDEHRITQNQLVQAKLFELAGGSCSLGYHTIRHHASVFLFRFLR